MGLPKLRSIFDAFLVPTWLHFASQNPPKTLQKPTPRRIKILIDFCIVFFSFWAPFWEPRISRIFPETAPGATQKRMNPLSATKSTPGTPTRPPECSTGASRDTFRQPKKAQGTPKKHQRTRVKLVGPAECAERLNPPAHLWWCYGRVKRMSFFSLPSLKEKQQVRAFRRVGRLCPPKLRGFEILRVKFRTLWRGRDSRA